MTSNPEHEGGRAVWGLPSRILTPWVRSVVARWWLPAWFAMVSVPAFLVPLVQGKGVLVDARLYVEASRAWLAGGDPWSANINGLYFAAPPPTLLAVAPFALLPDWWGIAALGLATFGGAVWTLRMLRLPAWWLLFPPLTQAVVAGNVQTLLVPLLLVPVVAGLAPLLKLYAIVPLVLRGSIRALALLAIVLLVSAPLLPWPVYLARFQELNATLNAQSQLGPTIGQVVILSPFALLALWRIGRERAAWLAVPALWPFQQWYYATLVLPARSVLVAAIVAAPLPFNGFLALVALAVQVEVQRRRASRRVDQTRM